MSEIMTEQGTEKRTVISELQAVIRGYLDKHSRISLNGLSKRCTVSEPTLRRIMHGQVKTAPTLTTVVDILSTINKEPCIRKLAAMYPGPLADVLSEGFSIFEAEELDYVYNQKLNEVLVDETSYLIYKMAANRCGLAQSKVRELFGLVGEEKIYSLKKEDLLEEKIERGQVHYHAKIVGFSLDHKLFIKNFQSVANFIKTDQQSGPKSNLYYNLSESVNEQGRREILRLQKDSLRKIAKILDDEKYGGDIPLFVISAVDDMNSTGHIPGSVLQ
ncbi:MAG: hypothetical protein ACJAT2_002710 [Bacteriovoracaceae bacterium]|jgi:hypothetical protein